MINHYEILGLSSAAGIVEIKAAFRQLAKQYHPDLNPEGKEQFSKILRAYEILSDPNLKYSYDYKLNAYQKTGQQPETQRTRNKNWKFDEREMKRRQYYNEHIKKYEKKYSSRPEEPEPKQPYNEFKYILFATPLAVALFLGIMTLASGNKKERHSTSTSAIEIPVAKKKSDLKMGDTPYSWHFDIPVYDTVGNKTLTVKNLSGLDIIMCLFKEERFIRSFFIENNYSAEVSQLPKDPLTLRYSCGSYFDRSLKFKDLNVTGGFQNDQRFFESKEAIPLNSINELTLLEGLNEGFKSIDEEAFFKK